MPRKLRMPSEEELPPGPLREFVDELHIHFRNAGRPSPAQIATRSEWFEDGEGVKVSRETVRRLLKGETTSSWPTVRAVHQALCELADQDHTQLRFPSEYSSDIRTFREYIRDLWNDAVEGETANPPSTNSNPTPVPQQSGRPGAWPSAAVGQQHSGWPTTGQGQNTYPEEPPF